ncbi:MAG: DNA polymerase IV [Actinobacteria bacterium]|nr:DNA polymerase IV [Actinomycetota bacterium]
MEKIILHLDMDAFFAAIEQLDNPQFRGKLVVVGADPRGGKGRGVVSTCSYEAREFGIHSAMPISQAYKRCPHAVYVFPRGKRYSEMSKKIMKILHRFSPDIEPVSIDEAFLNISSTCKLFGSVENLGKSIKKMIHDETQLIASVGIAPSKFVAKIASDLEKPDGLVIVDKDHVIDFLAPLEISRLWGVGKKTLPQLQSLGIHTIGDLARYSQKKLIDQFGKAGLHFWNLANGIDAREVERHVAAKSISKEVTFDVDKSNRDELCETLLYLCNELAREMRKKNYKGRTITLKIRLEDFSTFSRSKSFSQAINASNLIREQVVDMFSSFDRKGKKVRLLGVGLSHLQIGGGQIDLFEGSDKQENKIDRVIDQVREKFGEKAITRASLIHTQHDSQWIRD